jgi:aarF domain-containing kinase
MAQLLATTSRDIVDLLRINTVIRATSSALGVTMAERIRIYSAIAHRGLPRRRGGGGEQYIHPSFLDPWYRLQLQVLLAGLGVWSGVSSVAARSWETILGVFGEALFE